MLNYLPTIIIFILIFGLIIFVHELGHFITARRNGIKVTEFGFGMPPRIWGKKFGETLYSLNWIPIGGFVRMLGQDDFDAKAGTKAAKDPRSFENKTVWQRSKVLVAGVVMNFLTAWILFSLSYVVGIQPIIPDTSSFEKALEYGNIVVKTVQEDQSADLAGLSPGDQILKIDQLAAVDVQEIQNYIEEHAGENLSFEILRNEEAQSIQIKPGISDGKIGISMYQAASLSEVQYPFYIAPLYALEDVWVVSKMTLAGFGEMILQIFTELKISDDISGPIGIVQITHDVMQFGFLPLVQFAALLSVSLGVINILPFPALDGGRLLFLLAEAIRGKKHSSLIEGHIHMIGFLLLLALIVAVSFHDIMKLFA